MYTQDYKKCFIWTIIWYVVTTYAIYFHDRCFHGLLVGMKPITTWYYHLLLYAHSFHKNLRHCYYVWFKYMFRHWNGYSSWRTDFFRMLMFISHEIGGDCKNCWIFVTGWLLEMLNSCWNLKTTNYQFNSTIRSICMKLFCVDYVKIKYYLVYI